MNSYTDYARALGITQPTPIDPVQAAVARNQAIDRAEKVVADHSRRIAERRIRERRAEAARYKGGNRKNPEDRRKASR